MAQFLTACKCRDCIANHYKIMALQGYLKRNTETMRKIYMGDDKEKKRRGEITFKSV